MTHLNLKHGKTCLFKIYFVYQFYNKLNLMGDKTKLNKNMQYKYAPIYKYGFLLLTIYTFIKHQKIMTQDKLLLNSVIITIIIGLVDFIIINNHPALFSDEHNENFSKSSENNVTDTDTDDLDDFDLSIDKEIESLNSKHKEKEEQNFTHRINESYLPSVQVNYLNRVPQQIDQIDQFNQFDKGNRQYYSSDIIGSYGSAFH